jgi:hypothetical protein
MTTDHALAAEAERQEAADRCPLCGGQPDRCGCELDEAEEER